MEIRHKVLNANKMLWRRRDLRSKSTVSERILWNELRNNQLGEKFKRQYSIMNYVVDFYCHKAKLAIEIDGDIHKLFSSQIYDKYRTEYLKSLGIRESGFNNSEIQQDISKVLYKIKTHIPSPKIRRGN